MAKIIPGTYSIADYGRYLEDVQAFDAAGSTLPISKTTTNTWLISDAKDLDHISYLVNDTYDSEEDANPFAKESTTIFSPAGTNILAGQNFLLNMAGFVGYFEGMINHPYTITITHPADLVGVSALKDSDPSDTKDQFQVKRYAEMVDSPLMYSVPNIGEFTVDGMDVILSVYSPKVESITAESLLPDLERMMTAQKAYLGDINDTEKYAILNYITAMGPDDAKGIGALEHNFSTSAVFRENMTSQDLIDVISYEFFHTLTPLYIHSTEIQNFDFINPKVSEHLWMYEGFTEYFAQHFQIYENLVTEDEFMSTMSAKITASMAYNDSLSFTKMSKNVLQPEMKEQYGNVYKKGALMAMCLDIIIREKSNGERSLLDVMGQLKKIYGAERSFEDDELIPKFTELTYPEVGQFVQKHVVNGVPVDYLRYLAKVGMTKTQQKIQGDIVFVVGDIPYLKMDQSKTHFLAFNPDDQNLFYK